MLYLIPTKKNDETYFQSAFVLIRSAELKSREFPLTIRYKVNEIVFDMTINSVDVVEKGKKENKVDKSKTKDEWKSPKTHRQQRKQQHKSKQGARACRNFESGSCDYGDNCRFTHDRQTSRNDTTKIAHSDTKKIAITQVAPEVEVPKANDHKHTAPEHDHGEHNSDHMDPIVDEDEQRRVLDNDMELYNAQRPPIPELTLSEEDETSQRSSRHRGRSESTTPTTCSDRSRSSSPKQPR